MGLYRIGYIVPTDIPVIAEILGSSCPGLMYLGSALIPECLQHAAGRDVKCFASGEQV